jgi:hypothetical protein
MPNAHNVRVHWELGCGFTKSPNRRHRRERGERLRLAVDQHVEICGGEADRV